MVVEAPPRRRLFTREEYHRMGEVGILTERDRVELVRGDIVTTAPIGPRHSSFVANLLRLLITRLGDRAVVKAGGPIVVADDSEPEPDIAVVRLRATPYKERHASNGDTLLVIEVAESSLAYDRSTKLRLYAETGIPEYWIVDARAEAIDVHRAPERERYRDVSRISAATATVSPQAFADVVLTLAEIFA